MDSGDIMNNEENKIKEEELQQEVVGQEAEVVGTDADIDWNEQVEVDEKESQIAQLEAALLSSEAKIQEQKDSVLRAKAEVENMRRRSEQEIDKARKYALSRFAEELLPVLDNLERTIQAADAENEVVKPLVEGVELTHKTFIGVVEKFGLKEINPEGETFNPELHQAMSIQESPDHEPNTVMFVMQKGYELNGRVIRPAMVMVSK
ncbi:nucleotide exchange factor GrpE [Vibrio anguillarum]|uniref:Protein GrpE n=3 Tax=Vibrio TaxID=662 RepID=A0A1V9JW21_VIBAN|nr:GrpE [Vibrio anguillarum 775]AGU58214.1 heat shock protein GrpE [Vibrio anguillarum M3]ASF91268.1 nucleotide exchange factor GrpE [Vibrio anguillarum]OXX23190.1 nucleotide exchange factor GrpE [Vibrio sp. V08_P9A1T1]OXX25438.1 nucleotide exchange factor GrpE [Vibrio sp. V06_P1A73T115]OXX26903.1 nucleotide exchange factor GrpE [Vibrio sp. V05_P4A8T149]OXX31002.1 nucleotide exchange factor GrpE [Vibrio sp. V14_P6S14T42]OXX35877.1 nucleotide exchange factor GrpE [Vibrio sp. V09_P4A23P171]OX